VTGLEASAVLIYFFKPNEPVNPYVGAVLLVDKTEVELSTLGVSDDEDDTEAGIGAGAGVEIEATEDGCGTGILRKTDLGLALFFSSGYIVSVVDT
jgi:hypothetical protein